jgi:hypothetical protein
MLQRRKTATADSSAAKTVGAIGKCPQKPVVSRYPLGKAAVE